MPCENADGSDHERVEDDHKGSQAVAALHFAGIPFSKLGAKEGDRCDALKGGEERSPMDDRPDGVGKAGSAQSCGDEMQAAQCEHGRREQGHPNRPVGIETLGVCIHEIAASHPDNQEDDSEGKQWTIHEMPDLPLIFCPPGPRRASVRERHFS